MPDILFDPWFYAAAIPAVIVVGLAKGGLGGAMALLGVPILALVMPPVQAAAILLPVLVIMDIVSLWAWRGIWDGKTLVYMLPGALAGIGIGWLTAAIVTPGHVRLIVGVVALMFFLRWMVQKIGGTERDRGHSVVRGGFWGTIAGFTSFVAHAGGPPYQVYALPLGHDPKLYVGTSVIFFAVMNTVKLVPYFALGQFDTTNLSASAVFVPLAFLSTLVGAWVVKRIAPEVFYPFTYLLILLVSLKLIYDGVLEVFL